MLQHKITTCDCQPITAGSGIMVSITGDMIVRGRTAMKLRRGVGPCNCDDIRSHLCGAVHAHCRAQANGNVAAPVKFSQLFVLLPTAAGGWYMANDIFRTSGNATCNAPNPADKSGARQLATCRCRAICCACAFRARHSHLAELACDVRRSASRRRLQTWARRSQITTTRCSTRHVSICRRSTRTRLC